MRRFALIGLVCLGGCIGRPVEVPVPTRFHECPLGDSREIALLLPGRGDDIAAFERADFIAMLCHSARPMSAISIDAHMGYYRDAVLSERVLNDVLLPYEARGYSRFVIVGVSLGGLGAIRLARDFPSRIAGLVLLAPFLGDDDLISELERAGTAADWRHRLDHAPQREEQVWLWIDDITDAATQEIPNMIIGYGTADRHRRANEFLARSLPDSTTFVADGGHDWRSWTSLWSDILRSGAWVSLGAQQPDVRTEASEPP